MPGFWTINSTFQLPPVFPPPRHRALRRHDGSLSTAGLAKTQRLNVECTWKYLDLHHKLPKCRYFHKCLKKKSSTKQNKQASGYLAKEKSCMSGRKSSELWASHQTQIWGFEGNFWRHRFRNPTTDLWRDSLIWGLIFLISNGLMTSDFKCEKWDLNFSSSCHDIKCAKWDWTFLPSQI